MKPTRSTNSLPQMTAAEFAAAMKHHGFGVCRAVRVRGGPRILPLTVAWDGMASPSRLGSAPTCSYGPHSCFTTKRGVRGAGRWEKQFSISGRKIEFE
jgi:hypothetical protein